MSISGIGSVGGVSGVGGASRVGTIAEAQAASAPARQAQGADASPSAFFDMTGWSPIGEPPVTVGPAMAPASLPELSASVLAAVLR